MNSVVDIVNGHGEEVPLIPQSPWDARLDAIQALDPTRYEEVVDASQQELRENATDMITKWNAAVDAAQSQQLAVMPWPVDVAQWGTTTLTDVSVDAFNHTIDGGQAVARWGKQELRSGLEDLNEALAPLDEGVDLSNGVNRRRP